MLTPCKGTIDLWSCRPYRQLSKCEAEVIAQCRDLLGKELDYAQEDSDSFLDAAQKCPVMVGRALLSHHVLWRRGVLEPADTHMFETLQHLLDAATNAEGDCLGHNSHIGDARYTDMGFPDELKYRSALPRGVRRQRRH